MGFSALALASALPSSGRVVTLESSPDRIEIAKKNCLNHPDGHKVQILDGDALTTLQKLHSEGTRPFDMIFIDADKRSYIQYYDFILENNMLGDKGVIVVDNVLWKGKVVEEEPDQKTNLMIQFNDRVAKDERTVQVMMPVRDGVMLIMKAETKK